MAKADNALVVELVDTQDLKSCGQQCLYGFKSRPRHTNKRVTGQFYRL